jgi:hypothetical protein
LEEIDSSWSEDEAPTLDGDPTERVTQIPAIPSDQFARRLMAEVSSEPPLPAPTLVNAAPPQMADDEDPFERPTLVEPLEASLTAPPPAPIPQAAPIHSAIAPRAPRGEPHRVRGISDLPPVLRFGAPNVGAGAPQYPAAFEPSFSRAPTSPPDPDELDLDLSGPSESIPLDLSYEPPERFPQKPVLHNTSYSRGDSGPRVEATGPVRRPSSTMREPSISPLELDLDAGPGGALERAELSAFSPVRSGLELAQRFSSIPPPSTNPMRDMKDRYAMGDFSGALTVAEKILEKVPTHEEASRCAQSCRDVLGDMYASRIGNMDQSLVVVMSPDQIRWLSLDHRAGFLLSMIDGMSTVEELLDVCGMQRLDALRIICNLLDQRVVSLQH